MSFVQLRSAILPLAAAVLLLAGCSPSGDLPESGARPAVLPPSPSPANPSSDLLAVQEELRYVDPAADGFETELASDEAGKVLDKIGKLLSAGIETESLSCLVAEDFVGSELRPEKLELAREVRGLRFSRGLAEPERHRGRAGLAAALMALREPFDDGEIATKFKIVRVEDYGEDAFSTGILYLAMGSAGTAVVQQNARWQARWRRRADAGPELVNLEVADFEESRAPRAIYGDVTRSAFPDARDFDSIRRGIDSWWGRIDAGLGFSLYGDYGLALGDIDNDGLDDLYICQPGGLPNQLYRHNADGTLSAIGPGSGTDLLNDTPTALFADFDNDGNQDLIAATLLHLAVLRGDGRGGFTLASEIVVDNAVSLSAADYDGDGNLDLYVTRYSSSRSTPSGASIYDSNEGRPNVLLRNEGGLEFRDVTRESGIDQNNRRFSFAGVWEDYDNDGDQDLYVANDFGRNNLYRNDGGRFRDVAAEAGAEDSAAGMGASWADYNQDGLMDLYVSNMFSSAGGRIVDKPAIEAWAGDDAVAPLMRFAKGNTLLENRGDGGFRDVSDAAGVTMGRWSWGGEFVDFDNNGWPDLVVPNGFITNRDKKDL